MRKYIMPSVLILLGFAGYGVAQTINRAIQLSQDTTGAFSVDSNNGVYFPGHVISSTSINARPAPTITLAGNGTPTVAGTDFSGTITMGGGSTSAVLTFGTAYVSPPSCVLSQTSAITTTAFSFSLQTTSIRIFQPATSGNTITYVCPSAA